MCCTEFCIMIATQKAPVDLLEKLGLRESKSEIVCDALNALLADHVLFYHDLRHAHWTVRGPRFFELHEAFEVDYQRVVGEIDEIAERIRTLGGMPRGLPRTVVHESGIPDMEEELAAHDLVRHLIDDMGVVITSLRAALEAAQDADDEGSIDLLSGILRATEKRLWMYHAWVHPEDPR